MRVSDTGELSRSYHHGDLREALIEAAREIVETEGVDAFTLRECARRAGVSHGAPAHHFGDKTGLLTELAVRSIEERMALSDARVAAAADEPMAQLKACGIAHIDYMIAHPKLDDLCGRNQHVNNDDPKLQAAMGEMTARLIERMSAATGETLLPDKAANLSTVLAVAVTHGFAHMVNQGIILHDVPEPQRRIQALELAERMLDYMKAVFRP